MRLARYIAEYSKKTKIVKYWHFFIVLESFARRGPKAVRNFLWFVSANKLEAECEVEPFLENPSIELVVTTKFKDFAIIEKCINCALNNSLNKISLIKIVVPAIDFPICLELIQKFNLKVNLQLINEDELISENIRELIFSNTKNYYGWVLQQVIKIKLALDSNSKGVLIVDSDTLLLGKQLWLNKNGVQRLVVANTKYDPYFQFLKVMGIVKNRPKYSFVTHHMLMQPEIIKSLFAKNNFKSIEDLLVKIFTDKNFCAVENISLDYELYGQFIYFNFKKRYTLSRFCNLSLVSRNTILKNFEKELQILANDYHSISFHSWNQSYL